MGKAVNNMMIDEAFAGLLDPKQIHELGREDITSDRPGESLLKIVQEFGHEGFKNIVEKRAKERDAAIAAETTEKDKKLADFGLNSKQPTTVNDLSKSDD